MLKYLFFLGLFFNGQHGFSQTFIVKKVKGQQALVEITQGQLEANKEYKIELLKNENLAETHSTDRHYVIGLDGLILNYGNYNTSGSSSTNRSALDFKSYFGWNFGRIETGPIISFNSSTGTPQSSTYSLGGFLDYNFKDNTTSHKFISGILSALVLNNTDASGVKSSGGTVDFGFFIKWFPINDWFCLRSNLKFEYSESKNDIISTKTSAALFSFGLATYF